MKFSFEFEKYRKNLADELKEKRKESPKEARGLLSSKKKTEKYQIAKNIKGVVTENKKAEEQLAELEPKYETKDISNEIPDEIKIWIDKVRLAEINNTERPRYNRKEKDEILDTSKNLVNKLTNGDFYNPNFINTVIWAFNKPDRVLTSVKEKEGISLLQNKVSITPESGVAGTIWFASGGSYWYSPDKIIVIANPFTEKFQKHITNFEGVEKLKRDVEDVKGESQESGFTLDIRGKWKEFADWIVDLPSGKIYKMEENQMAETEYDKSLPDSNKKNSLP